MWRPHRGGGVSGSEECARLPTRSSTILDDCETCMHSLWDPIPRPANAIPSSNPESHNPMPRPESCSHAPSSVYCDHPWPATPQSAPRHGSRGQPSSAPSGKAWILPMQSSRSSPPALGSPGKTSEGGSRILYQGDLYHNRALHSCPFPWIFQGNTLFFNVCIDLACLDWFRFHGSWGEGNPKSTR